jgi:hypothetical protein
VSAAVQVQHLKAAAIQNRGLERCGKVFSGVLQAVGRRVHFDYVRQQTIQVAHVPGVPALSEPRRADVFSGRQVSGRDQRAGQ